MSVGLDIMRRILRPMVGGETIIGRTATHVNPAAVEALLADRRTRRFHVYSPPNCAYAASLERQLRLSRGGMMERQLKSALLAVSALGLLPACSTFHVYQDLGTGDYQPQNVPDNEWAYVSRNSFLWGLIRQDLPVDNCRDGAGVRKGMEQVRVDRDAAQGIAAVLTLGLWQPVTIGWRCNKLPGQTGTLGGGHRR